MVILSEAKDPSPDGASHRLLSVSVASIVRFLPSYLKMFLVRDGF
jgi:hypothetical protein